MTQIKYATIYLLLFSFSSTVAVAQDIELTQSEDDTSITQQVIAVKQPVEDQAIQQRLENIITASEWIQNAEVEVNHGIVVLNGTTNKETHRQWVESLTNKTDGVIAVINKVEVINDSSWNLEPAAKETQQMFNGLASALPALASALVILFFTWLAAKLVSKLARSALKRKIKSPFILNFTAKAFAIPAILIGTYLTLKLTGLTQLAVTIIGGTGLVGLVIGIAFRDIAENFLASILISIQRPFNIGDVIVIDDIKGMVQTVTTRGTVMMTMEGNHVHIPNSTIYKSSITNLTANPNSRKDFVVGIGYDDNITEAQDIILDILESHEAVLNNPEFYVLVENLGAATVNLKVYFWVNNKQYNPSKVKSSVIRLTKRAFDSAGVSMPDEAREVVFPDGIHVITEPAQSSNKTPTKSQVEEPLTNQSEQDYSSDDAEIKQQLEENPLPDDSKNLLS
ncbi:mechanosensitive ion channel family protein [Marinicella rhabdoformis]|uniref:mechanosensitive ion channel family protein n=1 Tax=Marinicella rhabdoformis TaxID=2580566 RepID=UPI0012AEB8A7|nr:mechanosensitive ion channel family protein [Marinicella rhabdoformis]